MVDNVYNSVHNPLFRAFLPLFRWKTKFPKKDTSDVDNHFIGNFLQIGHLDINFSAASIVS